MQVKGKVGNKKAPLFGTNMPGSAAAKKKEMGPVDRSANELKRNSDRMMKGYPDEAASESEKGAVSGENLLQPQKNQSAQEARTDRVNKMIAGMSGSSNAVEAEADENSANKTYKDWQPSGKSSAVIVAKKAVPGA